MKILAMEVMPDHIHLLVDCKPQLRLSDAIKILKGATRKGGICKVMIHTTYKVKIKHYNHIFKDTVKIYRNAVDYLIDVCDENWETLSKIESSLYKQSYIETLVHSTKANGCAPYDFDSKFYKFPSYLRRGAISEAIGKICSYKSNYRNWLEHKEGKEPGRPKAGFIYPTMYRTAQYNQIDDYTAQVKVYIRNTWDWLTISLRKSDMDYINRHCKGRKQCAPTLQKRGKEWFLDFPFEEKVSLGSCDVWDQTIVSVDLGINTPAAMSVMKSDGTILGRYFCNLPSEIDHLNHSINKIKKAQRCGNPKAAKQWARAKGINHDISAKTAKYIMDIAARHNADVIVFEHLDKNGKAKGAKKQKLKLWRSQEVQGMVTNKAHRCGMRIRHVCAWGTSKYAYDGSGIVLRGAKGGFDTYKLCKFPNGRIYNCDLSASYNIGARYFIREIIKSLNESSRLVTLAKVPECTKRSTCTLSTLINLNAELVSA